MKRISITKRKSTLHCEDLLCEKQSGLMRLDEKRKFGDERCGLIRGDEEVQGLEKFTLAREVIVR